MIVHIKEVLEIAQKDGFAVPAFNIHNIETCIGVVKAAEQACSPIIIQVSEGTIKYIGLQPLIAIVSTVTNQFAPRVPIALHLDHGSSFESAIACIKAGFSSVQIDASHLPLEQNIALTQQVVEFAHRKNVWVQGEVGAIAGGHGAKGGTIDIPKADLTEVLEFAKKSGVDTMAAAIGTAHGVYDNEAIDFKLLKAIKQNIKQPFVLHGASGVSDREIKKAIKLGINIINIGSDIKIAFSEKLIENCKLNKKETDPRKLLAPTIDAVQAVAMATIKKFGGMRAYCSRLEAEDKMLSGQKKK
jgi:fructose-bisphosphate aldolase class II